MEMAVGKRGPKIPKRMMMFCQVCHAISYVTNNCWGLEKISKSRPATWWSKIEEGFEEMNEETGVAIAMSAGGEEEVLEVDWDTVD